MKQHDQSLQSYQEWLRGIGVSNATGWRYRRRGWITTINIGGRHYLSADQISKFNRRAASGEFAVQRTPPPMERRKALALQRECA